MHSDLQLKTDGDYYRDLQLTKMQRTGDYGMPSPTNTSAMTHKVHGELHKKDGKIAKVTGSGHFLLDSVS